MARQPQAEILNEDCLSKEAKLLTAIRDECGHVVECWSADDLSKAFDKDNIFTHYSIPHCFFVILLNGYPR